ncbi:MAG: polymerase sigma-B factor [Thermoleophilaceae bacterium]|jgi:RNA polymerase sigma-B factor|nr:polymerase sigma-B factor [Thermoleophilaceae bacterium]
MAVHNPPREHGGRFLEPAAERARADAALLLRYRSGDRAARAEAMERFLPLARQLARRYARPNESIDDLFQVASIGLLKAVDRFDPSRGFAFSTFAVPTIVGELKRYFRDAGWAVHVPRPIQDRIVQINRVMGELSRTLGRSPTSAEVASAIGTSLEDVVEAMEAAKAFESISLETPRGSDEGEAGTYAETVGAPDEGYERVEYAATLEPTMAAMPARDRLILRLRFEEDLTQSEIANQLGISQMHVSRIIRRSLTRLRTVAEAA